VQAIPLREGEKQKAAQTVQKGAFEKGLAFALAPLQKGTFEKGFAFALYLCKKEPLKKGIPVQKGTFEKGIATRKPLRKGFVQS
jgi:hypothetical protein